jgi:hypothetical protein
MALDERREPEMARGRGILKIAIFSAFVKHTSMCELLTFDTYRTTLSRHSLWWDEDSQEEEHYYSTHSTLTEPPAKRRKMSDGLDDSDGDINNVTLPLFQLEEVEVECEGVVGTAGGGDVSMPRHDPHIHHSHAAAEDELDLERELEILLQSPMLFSSSSSQHLDLNLPSDPQFDDLESDFGLITSCPSASSANETSSTTLDGLIDTIFDRHPTTVCCAPTAQPAVQHVSIRPLLLPAPFGAGASATTSNPLAMSRPASTPVVHLPVSATVALTHKPRGSHGVWLPLNDSQRIRYTYRSPCISPVGGGFQIFIFLIGHSTT